MREGWKEVEIGDVCIIKGGKRLPKGHNLQEEITKHPYIRARDIKEGKINFDQPVYISENTFLHIKNYTVNEGDIILTIAGTIGETAIVNKKYNGASLTENAVKLICKKELISKLFLKYTFRTQSIYDNFINIASGSAQPKLGIYKIQKTKIHLPPLPTQRKIASILSAYDDLMENNLKRIKLLEEKAQLTYEEWFVKMRFPGYERAKFDEETGLPEGWGKKTIGEISNIKGGKRLPQGHDIITNKTNHPYIRVKDLTSGGVDLSSLVYINEQTHLLIKRYLITNDDIYISIAGTVGLVGIIPPMLSNANLTENCAKITEFKFHYLQDFVYYFLKNEKGQYHISARTGGASQPKLAIYRISEIPIDLPSEKVLKEFSTFSKRIRTTINNLQVQNNILKEARDILLPRLMSGMIDVEGIFIQNKEPKELQKA